MSLRNASCWMAIIELDEVMRVAARSLHGIHADSTCSSASKWRCSRPVSYTHLDVYKRQPYLMPQETGNHEDVRWAEITDDHGHGMRVSRADGAAPFAVSLLPYSSFMLEEAQHQDELPKPKHMFLRVLAAQMRCV